MQDLTPRFGFFFWPYSPEYTMRMARLGEEYGFDMVGIADTPGNAMDPWVAMTLAIGATTRVRLATGIVQLGARTPAMLAMTAQSLHARAGSGGGTLMLTVGEGTIQISQVNSKQ